MDSDLMSDYETSEQESTEMDEDVSDWEAEESSKKQQKAAPARVNKGSRKKGTSNNFRNESRITPTTSFSSYTLDYLYHLVHAWCGEA